jgi:hypothetical protein
MGRAAKLEHAMGNHVGARRNRRSVNSYLLIDELRVCKSAPLTLVSSRPGRLAADRVFLLDHHR